MSARFKVSGKDGWKWHWSSNNIFSVNKLSKIIQADMSTTVGGLNSNFLWSSTLPLKVNIFSWRLINNGIPLRPGLAKRGITLDSMNCSFCDSVEETLDHCFFNCALIELIWRKLWSWWNLSTQRPSNLDSMKVDIYPVNEPNFPRLVFLATCVVALWMIWKWRNRMVFAESSDVERIKAEDLFPHIQRTAALWDKSRKPSITLDLEKWCLNPQEALRVL